MCFLAQRPGSVRVQVEQTAPRVGKDSCAVVTGDVTEEQRKCDGHDGGLDELTCLVCTTDEVAGLGPGGCCVPSDLVHPSRWIGLSCISPMVFEEHFSYLIGILHYYNEKIKNLQISSYSYIIQNQNRSISFMYYLGTLI